MMEEQLDMQTKRVLFNVFILVIVLGNIALFSIVFEFTDRSKPEIVTDYQQSLKKFTDEYVMSENEYQMVSFITNFDDRIYNNSVFNESYRSSIQNFMNLSQKEFYTAYEIINNLAYRWGFQEVAKYGYDYKDYTRKGTPIHDQNGFNSSYVFAPLTVLEYQINNATNNASVWISLSAQEILDCCPECVAAKTPQSVYAYIKKYGVLEEKQYPYEYSRFNTEQKACRKANKTGKRYYISGYKTGKTCKSLEQQIAISPVVVAVDGRKFMEYEYSIFTDCERKATHYAVVVAISFDHWKLQNSWGRKWGENGYIRIGTGDSCGICLRSSMPVLLQA